MLDNLRNQSAFQEEEDNLDTKLPEPPKPERPRRSFDQITGMTGPQRFILAVMLFMIVLLLGVTLLLLSGKVVLSLPLR